MAKLSWMLGCSGSHHSGCQDLLLLGSILVNIHRSCHAMMSSAAFRCLSYTATTAQKGIGQNTQMCVAVCRPSSAAGTRSASRHAVLHASAALGPATSSGHAMATAANGAMPSADEQGTEHHANTATQTGRAVPCTTAAGCSVCYTSHREAG